MYYFFETEYRNQISIATILRTIWVLLYKDIFSWR